jgi:hypothetical protein
MNRSQVDRLMRVSSIATFPSLSPSRADRWDRGHCAAAPAAARSSAAFEAEEGADEYGEHHAETAREAGVSERDI